MKRLQLDQFREGLSRSLIFDSAQDFSVPHFHREPDLLFCTTPMACQLFSVVETLGPRKADDPNRPSQVSHLFVCGESEIPARVGQKEVVSVDLARVDEYEERLKTTERITEAAECFVEAAKKQEYKARADALATPEKKHQREADAAARAVTRATRAVAGASSSSSSSSSLLSSAPCPRVGDHVIARYSDGSGMRP